jgi:hypothetical protein
LFDVQEGPSPWDKGFPSTLEKFERFNVKFMVDTSQLSQVSLVAFTARDASTRVR